MLLPLQAPVPPPMPIATIDIGPEHFPPGPPAPRGIVSTGDSLPPAVPVIAATPGAELLAQQNFGIYDRDVMSHGGAPRVELVGNIPPNAMLQDVRVEYDYNNGAMMVTATLTSNQIWTAWNTDHTAVTQLNALTYDSYTSATATTAANIIWTAWNTSYTTGGATTGTCTYTLNGRVWDAWNDNYEEVEGLRAAVGPGVVQQYSRRNLSEAELKAALAREKKYREDAEAAKLKAEQAKARAEALLMGCLSKEQKEDLKNKGSFYVTIPHANGKAERYRIDKGSHGNVYQVDAKGSILRSFCIQPNGVPIGDVMLAQKLFVESDDQTRAKFWEVANITERAEEAKRIPHTIPRNQRYEYAKQHGLLH